MTKIDLTQLGFYALAGAPRSPRDLIDEVRSAEAMGLGHCFISERFNIKEAATLCGAAGAVSENIQITTAATNHTIRHPMVTASFASTMWRLTNGRFSLGLGRGIDRAMRAYGMTTTTTADLEARGPALSPFVAGRNGDGPFRSCRFVSGAAP